MTLAQELLQQPRPIPVRGRVVYLEDPPLRLAFNGELSADERRLLEQGVYDGPFSFEADQ